MPKKKYSDFIDEIVADEIEQSTSDLKNKVKRFKGDKVIEVPVPGQKTIKVMLKGLAEEDSKDDDEDKDEGEKDSKDDEDDEGVGIEPGSIGPRGVGLGAEAAEDREELRKQGVEPGDIPPMELQFDTRREKIRALRKKGMGFKEILKALAQQEKDEKKAKKEKYKQDLKMGLATPVTINPADDPMGPSMMDKAIKEEIDKALDILQEGPALNAASTALQQKLITLSRRISVEDLTPKQRMGLLSKMVALVGGLTILNSQDAGRGITGKAKALQGLRGLL
jgi:DNA-binding transcriptional MerR regulator